MKTRRSLILDEADRWLFTVVLLVSLYLTFRGHNAPGGGFIGGLVASAAFVLRYLAQRHSVDRIYDIFRPHIILGIGLLISTVTAIAPVLVGDSMLESHIWKTNIPVFGDIKIVSSTFFDIGVYLLVIGVVLSILVALGVNQDADDIDNFDIDNFDINSPDANSSGNETGNMA
jgi:multicomponent Na+:H+ antiporter subunit A